MAYWDCVYFLMVTMSTVGRSVACAIFFAFLSIINHSGYGDISCQTVLGKIAIVLFILVGLVTISVLRFLSKPYSSGNVCFKRPGNYWTDWDSFQVCGLLQKESTEKVRMSERLKIHVIHRRHIIVCGDISYETASNFLKDFLHKDRENVDVEVVFLHRSFFGKTWMAAENVFFQFDARFETWKALEKATHESQIFARIFNECSWHGEGEGLRSIENLKQFWWNP